MKFEIPHGQVLISDKCIYTGLQLFFLSALNYVQFPQLLISLYDFMTIIEDNLFPLLLY